MEFLVRWYRQHRGVGSCRASDNSIWCACQKLTPERRSNQATYPARSLGIGIIYRFGQPACTQREVDRRSAKGCARECANDCDLLLPYASSCYRELTSHYDVLWQLTHRGHTANHHRQQVCCMAVVVHHVGQGVAEEISTTSFHVVQHAQIRLLTRQVRRAPRLMLNEGFTMIHDLPCTLWCRLAQRMSQHQPHTSLSTVAWPGMENAVQGDPKFQGRTSKVWLP